jgi:cytosine deaminase
MNEANTDEPVVSNADDAASIVLQQAMWAAEQGTFPVGGCIIENATGRVVRAMHNNVLKPLASSEKTFTYDPTAHGERQLVYWYYSNQDQLGLPQPNELTVVTSLDPCAMCTGTLLTAGFNVGVVAIDDFAGINFNEKFDFNDLPPALRDLAKSKFGYYACGEKGQDPGTYVREYVGGPDVVFRETAVSAQRLVGCSDIFQASLAKVRTTSSESGLLPGELSDPAKLPDNSPVKTKFRSVYDGAFKLKIPDPRLPDAELYKLLILVKDSAPQAKNAVALLDPFGNVVLCLADSFDLGPVYTAFMNVTQAYATTRYGLMDDEDTRQQATENLTHPKYGTFVFLYAPNPSDSTTIMTLGAYGSTMEGPVPQVFPANFQYYNPPLEGTVEEFRLVIMGLPPFYTQLAQISAMKVAAGVD